MGGASLCKCDTRTPEPWSGGKGGEVMNPYVKKGLIVGLIGFAVGVPVGIAFLLIFSPSDWGPLMVSLHLFLSGVLAGVAIGSSVIYEA